MYWNLLRLKGKLIDFFIDFIEDFEAFEAKKSVEKNGFIIGLVFSFP